MVDSSLSPESSSTSSAQEREQAELLLITCCPRCNTRFRVSRSVLTQSQSAARGQVRCGSCLHVFRALDELDVDDVADQLRGVRSALSLEQGVADSTPDHSGERIEKGVSEPLRHGQAEHDAERASLASAPHGERTEATVDFSAGDSTGKAVLDGHDHADGASRAAQNLEDGRAGNPAEAVEATLSFGDAPVAYKMQSGAMETVVPVDDAGPVIDTEVSDDGAAEIDGVSADVLALARSKNENRALDEDGLPEQPVRVAQHHRAVLADDDSLPAFSSSERAGMARAAVHGLASEAQLRSTEAAPGSGRSWRWQLAGLVCLLIVLLGQIGYWRMSTYVQDSRWRGTYEVVCAAFACELPAMRALDKMRSQRVMVRPHPEAPGALRVNAIVANEADHAQPFPLLELRFSDAYDQPVAARRFHPSEYLRGEGGSLQVIPARTPVEIALDIIDPGAGAVNYRIAFR